mmetsp:Transcript_14379/g.21163  ORF Transcript_14379/g.21163 Transcript_14379/m.21163 type:complete len:100 (-) Transcript_14379:55-354(-)
MSCISHHSQASGHEAPNEFNKEEKCNKYCAPHELLLGPFSTSFDGILLRVMFVIMIMIVIVIVTMIMIMAMIMAVTVIMIMVMIMTMSIFNRQALVSFA